MKKVRPTSQRIFGGQVWITTKRCPRCNAVKDLTTEHWYKRRVKRADGSVDVLPSTYCRECSNKRRAEAARLKRRIEQLPQDQQDEVKAVMRGPCACCGRQRAGRSKRSGRLYCRPCFSRLSEAQWHAVVALGLWRRVFRHIGEELRLDQQWRLTHDRPRRWPEGHRGCLVAEIEWRTVVSHLHHLDQVTLSQRL